MKNSRQPPLHKRLIFWLNAPLLVVLILFALVLQFFYLAPIKEFIHNDIRRSMHDVTDDVYKICERNFLESLNRTGLYDEKEVRIKKAWTLGAIENLTRREEVEVFISRNGRELLASERTPGLADRLQDSAANKFKRGNDYIPFNIGGKEYYVETVLFEPWHWNIFVLRERRIYTDLLARQYYAYGASFVLLLGGGLLFFLFLQKMLYKPIHRILLSLEKGKKPDYMGIYEFQYLSDQFKKSLEKQEAEQQKYRSVVESSPLGILIFKLEENNDLVFTGANQAANDILKVDCRQFIGKNFEEAFPPLAGTELPARYRQVCRDGKPWHKEHVDYMDTVIEGGTYEVHAFQVAPGRMAVFFRDITNQLKLEGEVQKAKKIESIGILAGGIAHDFNNLLTSILGNVSLAKRIVDRDDKVYDMLDNTEKAISRAHDLTYQLLTFARGGAPVTAPSSIEQLVQESVNFTASGSNAKCSFAVAGKLWQVEIDQGQISQVMQNITTNALQAMPGGGNFHIGLENYEKRDEDGLPLANGRYVRITMTDEGPGVPASRMDKIFDPFYTTKAKGSGLGLAICYSIVRKHRGHISVSSKKDSGTSFQVYLPATRKKQVPEKLPRHEEVNRGLGRILVMDDNENVREIAAAMLSHAGYKVELAEDGLVAIEYYRNAMSAGQPYDLVILDLTVRGGMGGRKTMEKLRELDPQVRAIVSSGYSNDKVMTDFYKYGFNGAVTKPYTIENLSRAVHEILRQAAS